MATFVTTLRDGEGIEMQRLEAVRVPRTLAVSADHDADLAALRVQSEGEIESGLLVSLFEGWWEDARSAAEREALRRARAWRQDLLTQRRGDDQRLRQEHQEWNEACREAILGEHKREYEQLRLFPERQTVPGRVLRQLRHHEEREAQRRLFLDRRLQIEEPSVEPLGVLLRVPLSAREHA